jgi:hypothetical protein
VHHPTKKKKKKNTPHRRVVVLGHNARVVNALQIVCVTKSIEICRERLDVDIDYIFNALNKFGMSGLSTREENTGTWSARQS